MLFRSLVSVFLPSPAAPSAALFPPCSVLLPPAAAFRSLFASSFPSFLNLSASAFPFSSQPLWHPSTVPPLVVHEASSPPPPSQSLSPDRWRLSLRGDTAPWGPGLHSSQCSVRRCADRTSDCWKKPIELSVSFVLASGYAVASFPQSLASLSRPKPMYTR